MLRQYFILDVDGYEVGTQVAEGPGRAIHLHAQANGVPEAGLTAVSYDCMVEEFAAREPWVDTNEPWVDTNEYTGN